MAEEAEEELVEDAQIDGVRGPSRFGGFVRGLLAGGIVSAGAALAVSLTTPLPDHLPGVGRVEIVGDGAKPEPGTDAAGTAAVPQVQDPPTGDKPERAAQAPIGQEPTGDAETPAAIGPSAEGTAPGSGQPAAEDAASRTSEQESEPEPADTGQGGTGDGQADSETAGRSGAETTQDNAGSAEVAGTGTTDDSAGATQAGTTAEDGAAGTEAAETGTTDDSAGATRAEATATAEDTQGSVAGGEVESGADTGGSDQIAALVPADSAAEDTAAADLQPTPDPEGAEKLEPSLEGPALTVNARSFDAPQDAPLLAVVLADAGNGAVPDEAFSLMTMPLTLAIRPDGEGALDLAKSAKSAGHEILAELPVDPEAEGTAVADGALASTLPQEQLTALTSRYLAALDLAIGATTPDNVRLVNNPRAMEAVLGPVAQHGFAYLDLKAGIGSPARRIAGDTGLRYAGSNRYVAAGATEEQVYQMLEGAAFQARRQGSAIVAIAASQAALKALVRWGLERGGQEVWFAPLSAVIARQQAG